MAVPNLSELATATLEKRVGRVADNIGDNNALFFMLQEKAEKPLNGGRLIYEPLTFQENSLVTSYSGYEVVPVGAVDVLSAAEYNWKQYLVPVTISGEEEMKNNGESEVFSLLTERIQAAEISMKNRICLDLYADGTGNGGKNITGLDAVNPQVATSGTYGGIDRATYTFWRNQTRDSASTPTTTTIHGEMLAVYLSCSRQGDKPDLIISGSTIYQTFVSALALNQRFTNAKLADAGFNNVEFMGTPVVFDGGIGGNATATDMHFINTKFLHWRPHSKRNFVPGKKKWAHNQDASLETILFMGNLTCSGAQFQGRLKGD